MIATHIFTHHIVFFVYYSFHGVNAFSLSISKMIVIYKSFFCEYDLENTKQRQKLCHRERKKYDRLMV